MKIGIIGTGNVAKAHAKAITQIPDLQLLSAFNTNTDSMKNFNSFFNVEPPLDYEDFLNASDAIIIASPNHTHTSYTTEILAKGKHVLCEKPMSTNLQDALKMLDFSKRNPAVSCVGFNYRHLEIIRVLKKLIDSSEFGEIISIDLEFNKSSAISRKVHTWRDSHIGGFTSGAIGDLGTHLIDCLSYLMESEIDLSSLSAKITTNVSSKENKKVCVDDYSIVKGTLSCGTYFSIQASKISLPQDIGLKIKIIGTHKEFLYHSQNINIYYLKSKIEWEEIEYPFSPKIEDPPGEFFGWQDTFLRQLLEWKSVIEGKPSKTLATFEDGYSAQNVLTTLIHNQMAFIK